MGRAESDGAVHGVSQLPDDRSEGLADGISTQPSERPYLRDRFGMGRATGMNKLRIEPRRMVCAENQFKVAPRSEGHGKERLQPDP